VGKLRPAYRRTSPAIVRLADDLRPIVGNENDQCEIVRRPDDPLDEVRRTRVLRSERLRSERPPQLSLAACARSEAKSERLLVVPGALRA
jgi:hypothetical protein